MERTPHFLTVTQGRNIPSNLLFFDTETRGKIDIKDRSTTRHRLWFGYLTAFRLENSKRTRSTKSHFTTIDQFWKLVESRTDNTRPLWCFAHNLIFDLTICDFFALHHRKHWRLETAIIEDPPNFLLCWYKKRKVYFVDSFNYYKSSLQHIGESVSICKLPLPKLSAKKDVWYRYCKVDVDILEKAMVTFIEYIRDNHLGSFAVSAPSQAMRAFRTRFMDHEILIHTDKNCLKMERDSYYGGRVECFYLGELSGNKYYLLDVNSLYPSVMLNNYPTIKQEFISKPSLKELKLALKESCVIATVEIDSKYNTYPCKYQDKFVYSKGNYITSLVGPELQRASNNKDIKRVLCLATYSSKPLFKRYVEFFYKKRLEFKSQNNRLYEQLAKLFLNSLYGKFGQRGLRWVDMNDSNMIEALKERELNYENPQKYLNITLPENVGFTPFHFMEKCKPLNMRWYCDRIQIRLEGEEHTESCPAIAAYVTAYARERLNNLIELAQPKNVFYCDTDSLLTNDSGLRHLHRANELDDLKLGKLKIQEIATKVEIKGLKDYVFGTREVIKGIRKDAIQIADGEYIQNHFEGFASIIKRGGEAYIDISWIRKILNRKYTKGIRTKDGWVLPLERNWRDEEEKTYPLFINHLV